MDPHIPQPKASAPRDQLRSALVTLAKVREIIFASAEQIVGIGRLGEAVDLIDAELADGGDPDNGEGI